MTDHLVGSGLLAYVTINGSIYVIRKISRERLLPENFEEREARQGTCDPPGALVRPGRSVRDPRG